VQVNEYRHGKYIGSVRREIEVFVDSKQKHAPFIVNHQGLTTLKIKACVKDTTILNLKTNNIDTSMRVSVKMDSFKNFHVSIDTSAHPVIHIRYMPDSTQASSRPKCVYLYLSDSTCPIPATRIYALQITTVNCKTSGVSAPDVLKQQDIQLSPTVTHSGPIFIINNMNALFESINVFDAMGRLIQSVKPLAYTIETNKLATGLYYMRFTLRGGQVITRLFLVQ
jgi:hypothetical protein